MNTELTQIEQNLEAQIAAAQAVIRNAKAQLFQQRHANSPTVDKKALAAQKRVEKYTTSNGLTIHSLRLAGNQVLVTHTRYIAVPVVKQTHYGFDYEAEVMLQPVPSNLRAFYGKKFEPKGGSTHLVITTPQGESIASASFCHELDQFDYRLGVKNCLNHFTDDEAAKLLNPDMAEQSLVPAEQI